MDHRIAPTKKRRKRTFFRGLGERWLLGILGRVDYLQHGHLPRLHEIAKEIHSEIFTRKQPHLNSRNKAQNAAPRESLYRPVAQAPAPLDEFTFEASNDFVFDGEEKVDVFFCVKKQVDVYIYVYIYWRYTYDYD